MVSLILPEYSEQVSILICTGVTILPVDLGEVVIMEFRKGLWFWNIIRYIKSGQDYLGGIIQRNGKSC